VSQVVRRPFGIASFVVVIFACASSAQEGVVAKWEQQAREFESRAEWAKACDLYESILRFDRSLALVKEKYQYCLRRYWQSRRHRDMSYRKEVLSLDYGQALRLYSMMRDTLLDNSLEKKKANPGLLFQKGLEEFESALADPLFRQQYLITANPEQVRQFRNELRLTWGGYTPLNKPQALKRIREVALAAQNTLKLSCTVTIMEFTCGACYALDDYTLYLTPNHLRELCDSLRGSLADVGVAVRAYDMKLIVQEVAPFSPAAKELSQGDEILSIEKRSTRGMMAEEAAELLTGPQGSNVELEVLSAGMGLRTIVLRRQTLFLPSVVFGMKSEAIGYIGLNCFKDSTAQELDDAIASLLRADMKTLVLDLRGNDGGLFEVAIDAAQRFLSSGVITSTENVDPIYNKVYEAKNPGALAIPMIVLVDGDTASAAEVLAGALKEHKRARLIGQTTFGKGCTQCLLKFPSASGGVPTGGLRLTVARFFSPDGFPYSGRGVAPHLFVDRFTMPGSMMGGSAADPQMEAALLEAQRFLDMR